MSGSYTQSIQHDFEAYVAKLETDLQEAQDVIRGGHCIRVDGRSRCEELREALVALHKSAFAALDLYFNWDAKFSMEADAHKAIEAAMDDLDATQKSIGHLTR